ncbi:Sec-independent protein translocase protein TatB [Methyloferula stellata]|uniref:Sec-independent protein translocase protein TatB n=1 Tax=Methyloferula stellata TaxID=876270 RepID=UPI0003740C75|nr:Sec-independent protein translocase protein TatB [Methyloferula stellata]
MFDFDVGKLFIIGIVALVVIGPKELPRVLRQVGQAVAKLRRMSADFQKQFMDAMHEADMADIKAEAQKLAEAARVNVSYDPIREVKSQMTEAVKALEAPKATSMQSEPMPPVSSTPVPAELMLPPQAAELPAEGPMKGPPVEVELPVAKELSQEPEMVKASPPAAP